LTRARQPRPGAGTADRAPSARRSERTNQSPANRRFRRRDVRPFPPDRAARRVRAARIDHATNYHRHPRTVTRATTWALAAVAAALFLLLCGAFGNGLVVGPFWNGARWLDSPAITWLLTGSIVAAGF